MSRLTIRFPKELYENLQGLAAQNGSPLADTVRQAVSHFAEYQQTNGAGPAANGRREIERLAQQAKEKDEQIRELHQIIAMAQQNLTESQKQFANSQAQLENKRLNWWRKLLRGKSVKNAHN